MYNYMFHTSTTMKSRDSKKWWIDSNIIQNSFIEAENISVALQQYKEQIENDGITISRTAIKNKEPMYVDKKDGSVQQVGYIITGKTSFENDCGNYVDKYVDLWIDIREYTIPDFIS